MDDKVGSRIPSEKDVQKWIDDLQALADKINAVTITLSTDERKHTLKFRPGGEKVVSLLGTLATQREVKLANVTVDGMRADLLLAQRLRPVAAAVGTLAQRLNDTILEAESECWSAATAYYSVLGSHTRTDAELQTALTPAVDFFSTGRRRGKVTPPA